MRKIETKKCNVSKCPYSDIGQVYSAFDIQTAILEFGAVLRGEYGYKDLTDSKIQKIFDEYIAERY